MLAPPPLPRSLEAALRDLASTRGAVRASAVGDLVEHARRVDALRGQAVGLLEQRLADEDPAVRGAAAVGLGDLRGHEALAALLVAVEDADPHVRQMALTALGEVGDGRALPRVHRALRDARPEMRYQAVIALGLLESDDATLAEALTLAVADDDAQIRYIALRVLEEAVDAGRALGGEPLRSLARGHLKDAAPGCAVAAALYLAKLGDDAGRDVLLAVVEGRMGAPPCDKEDERAAVEMAGERGFAGAIPALERRAFGLRRHVLDTCAFHARVALVRLGHERAVADTLRDLHSGRRERVEAAVVTIGRARLVSARAALEQLTAHGAEPRLVAEALAKLDAAPAAAGAPRVEGDAR